MPVEVRIMASSVGENSKLEVAFADANFASTKLGSASDRPRRIFIKQEGVMDMEVKFSKLPTCFGKKARTDRP